MRSIAARSTAERDLRTRRSLPRDAGHRAEHPRATVHGRDHPSHERPANDPSQSPMACVREGVLGSTSTTYSPTAATARTIPQMPPRTSITAAAGVNVRSPETQPRPRASKRAVAPELLPG